MVSVKVKIRKSTVAGKPGSVCYRIYNRQKSKLITSRIRLQPEQWDNRNESVILTPECDADQLRGRQRQITHDVELLKDIIRELYVTDKEVSLDEVAKLFEKREKNIEFFAFFKEQTERLLKEGKFGTARNYRHTLSSLQEFTRQPELSLFMIDEQFIKRYEAWLKERNVTRNTSSFYMRVIRAVFNKAALYLKLPQGSPFDNVYTGVDHTRKLAVGIDEIVKLQQLDLSAQPQLELARDIFLFSFYTRGMSFVDIAYLRKDDLQQGAIRYHRRKTGKTLSIQIEPCIQSIIARYATATANTPYVFPLLTAKEDTKAFTQYQTQLGVYNRSLKQLGKMLNKNVRLSSYTARHTWATLARNNAIPVAVISAAMGHSSERTTQIYLDSLEDSVIDRANHKILSFLQRKK